LSLCTSPYSLAGERETKQPRQHPPEDMREFRVPEIKVHLSCPEARSSSRYDATKITVAAGRFRSSSMESWRLTIPTGAAKNNSDATLHFQILECPPLLMASAFHVQSSTERSIFPGTVGPRFEVEEGCGRYNASVPMFLSLPAYTANASAGKCGEVPIDGRAVAVEAFWTSQFRNHVNQMHDMKTAEKIKAIKDNTNTTPERIAEMLGADRLEYLARHLDVLPGFPVVLELPRDVTVPSFNGGSAAPERPGREKNSSDITPLSEGGSAAPALPNCSEVPLADWLPVGALSDGADSWKFQSTKCSYAEWTREDLNFWLAGLRVRFLADSHGQHEQSAVVQPLVCPEAGSTGQYFDDGYDCPQRPNNTFSFGWRFFRAILDSNGNDHDGLAKSVRYVREEACARFLGLGHHNVTIITTPTWLFAYEIQEGLDDYVRSLGDLIRLCRRQQHSPIEDHVLLLQSPTAADVHPDIDKEPSSEWRNNHNYREEAFTRKLYKELAGEVDGIIPVFEWTLARNWIASTSDGVHLSGTYYKEVFHLQIAAIVSAMKFSKGWDVPLVSREDVRARWFVGVPLD